MSRLLIDRLDIALDGVDAATAQALRRELPAALQRRLASAGAWRQGAGLAELGTLSLPHGLPPRALADAIAARLGQWLQPDAATPER